MRLAEHKWAAKRMNSAYWGAAQRAQKLRRSRHKTPKMLCFGLFWFVLVCFGLFWFVLVCFGLLWFALVCFGFGLHDLQGLAAGFTPPLSGLWLSWRFFSFCLTLRQVVAAQSCLCQILPITPTLPPLVLPILSPKLPRTARQAHACPRERPPLASWCWAAPAARAKAGWLRRCAAGMPIRACALRHSKRKT